MFFQVPRLLVLARIKDRSEGLVADWFN